jgi:tRNA(His) 5'-end guanylyltransferase
MKEYEARYAPRLMPLLPTLARIDGKSFHTFTRGLHRPFDHRLVELMRRTTEFLVKETRALVGYTQSDEITLCYYSPSTKSQIFFDGKSQKLTSVLASMATACFNAALPGYIHEKAMQMAFFDCRVWQVPTLCEAANVFVWRELDATRNSLEMLARAHFSHKALLGVGAKGLHEMLHGVNVNWNDLPSAFKRGSYFGWKEFELPHDCAALKCAPGPHPGPKYRKRLVDLALEPLLTYPDRVRTLFGVQHTCEVTHDAVSNRPEREGHPESAPLSEASEVQGAEEAGGELPRVS